MFRFFKGCYPQVLLEAFLNTLTHMTVYLFVSNGLSRGRSRTTAASKMEHFVIIVNGWKPLTIITKSSILDAAAVRDPPLIVARKCEKVTMQNLSQKNHMIKFCFRNYVFLHTPLFYYKYEFMI